MASVRHEGRRAGASRAPARAARILGESASRRLLSMRTGYDPVVATGTVRSRHSGACLTAVPWGLSDTLGRCLVSDSSSDSSLAEAT